MLTSNFFFWTHLLPTETFSELGGRLYFSFLRRGNSGCYFFFPLTNFRNHKTSLSFSNEKKSIFWQKSENQLFFCRQLLQSEWGEERRLLVGRRRPKLFSLLLLLLLLPSKTPSYSSLLFSLRPTKGSPPQQKPLILGALH